MLESLLAGRTQKDFERLVAIPATANEQELVLLQNCIKGGLWGWDLVRLIHLVQMGYTCAYVSYEDCLDWCLRAARKMQQIFGSWDELINSYLQGYAYWSDEDFADEDSELYERKSIYEELKKMPNSIFRRDFKQNLQKEW